MRRVWRGRPVPMRKIEQLLRLVRESHERPMTGVSRPVNLVDRETLGVTFIGHSSFLLQVNGRKVVVDLVLLTHAHMDHRDLASLRRVVRATRRLTGQAPEVVVPRGVEYLVESTGFSRVHRLEWWESVEVQGLKVTMTPCRHWGARMFRDVHRGYGGYVVEGGGQSVYHSGDTAYFEGFREIGRRLQPEVALLPIGAYFPDSYRSVHTSPEEAVRAFVELGADQMVPMHYGTFRLGREPMDEPLKRLEAEAARLRIKNQIKVLEEGETMQLSSV